MPGAAWLEAENSQTNAFVRAPGYSGGPTVSEEGTFFGLVVALKKLRLDEKAPDGGGGLCDSETLYMGVS